MISRHEYRGGAWVDLEQPTEEEILEVVQEFSIPKQFEKELVSPTPAPLVAVAGDSTLLVLHFPTHGAENGTTKDQEIDFIIGERFIITIRYEVIAPLYHLKKLLETQKLIAGKDSITTDAMIEVLFAHLYASVRDHTDHAVENITRIERNMFDGHERAAIRAISDINREFLHIEAMLANQEEPLTRFLKAVALSTSFGQSFAARSERILAEHTQAARLISTHRAIAAELRETNAALLGARQNEIMKTLTTVNFIFLPLGLITWTFAMRTEGMPLIDSPDAFWTVLGIMLGVATLLTVFFIRKRWLF